MRVLTISFFLGFMSFLFGMWGLLFVSLSLFRFDFLYIIFFIFLSTIILSGFVFKIAIKQKTKTTLIPFVIGILFALYVTYYFLGGLEGRPKSFDSRRIADIKQMQLALELYKDQNKGLYPPLDVVCSSATLLEKFLVPDFLHLIYSDPRTGENYTIAVSSNRARYVLKTILDENIAHTALSTDLDGIILGCDCNDPAYCVSNE